MYNLSQVRRFSCLLAGNTYFKYCIQSSFRTKKFVFSVNSIHSASNQKQDSVKSEKNCILVYEAPLKNRVKIVKLLSLSSSLIGFGLFPTVIYDLYKINIIMAISSSLIMSFFLSTPFMLHWITKRYVLELHYEKETKTFTAKTFNIICQIVEMKFKAEDVIVPELPGMLSSIVVKGKPLFVDANMVQDPDAYSHMMGYDKPFDLAIKVDSQSDNSKTG